uniref:Ig-like domain-containing protein n=1 Tax=Catharus ustulatus TaxID=91951 RepID=A0A8C3U3Q1_CATUS
MADSIPHPDPRFSLHQPQDNVLVAAGETLTLNCTVSGMAVVGAVKWLKGWGSENKTIYDYRTPSSFPRVIRAVRGSDTDLTIHIRNVQPEDTGTYYCVKFTKNDRGEDVLFQRGRGTEVSVQAKPSPLIVSGPEQRVRPGESVPFTCTTGGFFPKEIGVKWFKDNVPIRAQQPQITEWKDKTYNMSSTVMVTLQKNDVPSHVTCEVQHSTLLAPLRGTRDTKHQALPLFPVPPTVEMRAEPSSVELNTTVTFTCLMKEFYPPNVSISWLENGKEMKVKNLSRLLELSRGLFQLRSWVAVQAMEEKNGSTIACVVVHDGQAPANYSAVLWITNVAHGESQMDKGASELLPWGACQGSCVVSLPEEAAVPGKTPCGGWDASPQALGTHILCLHCR